MSDENDRPLRDWTLGHIFSFAGIALFAIAGWVALNSRVTSVETALDQKAAIDSLYRTEQIRRSERLEDKVDSLLAAQGIKPER